MGIDAGRKDREIIARYEPLTLAGYFRIVGPAKWKILAFGAIIGVTALLVTYALPNLYRTTAVIKPEIPEPGRGVGPLGALANLGISVGGPSKLEDLEVLFNSKDLTSRVFTRYNLWPLVFPKDYDARTGLMSPGWTDRLQGRSDPKPPGNWDAIRAARKKLKVGSDKRTGILTISFDAQSPEVSARAVRYYLEEAKSRLQEEALARANQNKKFLLGQIDKTNDPIIRDRLYVLLGQEVEKEMLAKNREQFGFILIDAPEIPDRKNSPKRVLTTVIATLTGLMVGSIFVLVRRGGSQPEAG